MRVVIVEESSGGAMLQATVLAPKTVSLVTICFAFPVGENVIVIFLCELYKRRTIYPKKVYMP